MIMSLLRPATADERLFSNPDNLRPLTLRTDLMRNRPSPLRRARTTRVRRRRHFCGAGGVVANWSCADRNRRCSKPDFPPVRCARFANRASYRDYARASSTSHPNKSHVSHPTQKLPYLSASLLILLKHNNWL